MSENNSLFSPPADVLLPTRIPAAMESNPGHVREDHSPSDSNFRYFGQRVDGEKTEAASIRVRQSLFATVKEFAAWRRSKAMPELSASELEAAFERFTGRPAQTISAGDAGTFVSKK
jgi:hypothetical protein